MYVFPNTILTKIFIMLENGHNLLSLLHLSRTETLPDFAVHPADQLALVDQPVVFTITSDEVADGVAVVKIEWMSGVLVLQTEDNPVGTDTDS